MPRGPIGFDRPGTKSTLLMEVRETPVAEKDPEPMFPMSVIRSSDTEKEIRGDIEEEFEREVSVKRDVSFTRGLGETKTFKMVVDISGMSPTRVNHSVENLVESGYNFTRVEFE